VADLGARQSNGTMDGWLGAAISHRNVLFCVHPDRLADVAQRYADRGWLDGRHAIGYWHWGIDAFPGNWRHALDRVDEMWVATDFSRKVLQRVTDKPVFKIPHAIDATPERAYRRAEFALPEDLFLFLVAFDFHSFCEGKNPGRPSRVPARLPEPCDRAGLVVKCAHGDAHPEALAALRELAKADPRFASSTNSSPGCAARPAERVRRPCLPPRAEGFGRIIAECMAAGKPVIATAWSGNVEFMTPENACLVDYTLIPVRPGEYAAYEPDGYGPTPTSTRRRAGCRAWSRTPATGRGSAIGPAWTSRALDHRIAAARDSRAARGTGTVSARAYWACCIPASSQPLAPSRGLVRCQISSTGSAFAPSSRTVPVRRTLTT
jgi:hypothetical protein